MWQLARSPRWIAALVLCLAIAGAFAALGQWQLSRSVERAVVDGRQTEQAVPLESLVAPNETNRSEAAGQKVTVSGTLVAGDFVIIGERLNQGQPGYWVMAHLETFPDAQSAPGPSLAVAVGWAPSKKAAQAVVDGLAPRPDTSAVSSAPLLFAQEYTGRYLTTEAPSDDDYENGEQKAASVAALINQWAEPVSDGVYGGFLVLDTPPAGLDAIDSPVPSTEVTLNWLNIFYAIEWAVFAVFAVFLWFRLVKDAWEREEEEREEAELAAAATAEPHTATHVN